MKKYRVYAAWTGNFVGRWDISANSPQEAMNVLNHLFTSRQTVYSLKNTLPNIDTFLASNFEITEAEEI